MKNINPEKELEEVGGAAVRDLLRCLPGAKVTPLAPVSKAGNRRQADGLVRVSYGDTTHLLGKV